MDTHNEGRERNKKCPFCAEEIKEEAIFCRYCKRDLPIVQETVSSFSREEKQKKTPSIKWKPILLIFLGFIVIAGIAGGFYYQNNKKVKTEQKALYIGQFVEITTDYIDNFLYIQSITSSPDAYYIFLNKEEFDEIVYPSISNIIEDQLLLESLSPPEEYKEFHEETIEILKYFTEASKSIEKFSQTDNPDHLTDATRNIQNFNDNFYRLEELVELMRIAEKD